MAETVKRYRKAAEQGHAGAQYNLGEYYANGQGVSKDIAEARRWYQKPPIRGMKVPRRPCSNRRLLLMYDLRCTMYDLESSRALRGNLAKLGRTGCNGAVRGNG